MRLRPLILGMFALWSPCWPAKAGDVATGRTIYREGKLVSGSPLRGVLEGDVEVGGAAASCSRCHRPSGFGSSEGASIVPPITGPSLFLARQNRRADMIRGLYQDPLPKVVRATPRTPRDRPAYTEQSLASALRTGKDPSGRVLDPLMPRYDLGDDDMASLILYLRTLAAVPDPGVDDRSLHLATVVSEGIDPARRRALISVIEAFARARNLEIRRERDRPGFSPHFKGEYRDALRECVIHVWILEGRPDTWGDQLDAHYHRQPVFAIVSGLVEGGWRPVHEFSARSGVPCLFPATDLPVTSDVLESPTVYLSKGLTGEAQALGSWLSGPGRVPPASRIVQVYRPTERGTTLAGAFRHALRGRARAGLVDHALPADDARALVSWYGSVAKDPPPILVLWLTPADLATLPPPEQPDQPGELYLSGGLIDTDVSSIPRPWLDRARLTYPYVIPGREEPQIHRARAWLRSRKVERGPERLQLAAFLAMSVLEHSLDRMVDHFSRDYLIECVEHEAENSMNPGLFPQMSLGPGQRFASKGCYIVSPPQAVVGEIVPLSPWIIP